MSLTTEQRSAQRKIVGTLNRKSMMWFERDVGLCIWRDERASEDWGAGIPELSAHFDVLEIPYAVRLEVLTVQKKKKAGFTLFVRWDELPTLTSWVPSFQKQIDNAQEEIAAG